MRKPVVLSLLILITLTGISFAQPKIYLIRHAEKLANWPGGKAGAFQPLSDKGVSTANRLADYFENGSLKAIYSSPTTRTLHTGFPLAQKLGLHVEITKACSDTSAIETFYESLAEKYSQNNAILLVSHSNIVPYLLIKAGLPKDCYKKMDFTDWNGWLLTDYYGELFLVEKLEKTGHKCEDFKRIKF